MSAETLRERENFAASMKRAQRHLLATNLLRAGVMPSQLAGVIAEVEGSFWLAVTIRDAVTAAVAADAHQAAAEAAHLAGDPRG